MSDSSRPSYHNRRSLMDQLTGAGPNSTRTLTSISRAQAQVDQRIRNGEMNPDGTRR